MTPPSSKAESEQVGKWAGETAQAHFPTFPLSHLLSKGDTA